jgi:hypothetical protein
MYCLFHSHAFPLQSCLKWLCKKKYGATVPPKKKSKWYIKMVHQNTLPSNVYYYCGHQNGDPHGTATTSCPAKVP